MRFKIMTKRSFQGPQYLPKILARRGCAPTEVTLAPSRSGTSLRGLEAVEEVHLRQRHLPREVPVVAPGPHLLVRALRHIRHRELAAY